MLETFKGFLLFIVFLVPGFVFRTVEGQFVYLDKRLDWGRFALGLLTRSTFVYLPASPLIYHAWNKGWILAHPFWSALAAIGVLLIVPAILGLLSGIVRQKQFFLWCIERIHLRTFEQHHIPTAWDRVFSQTDEPSWVILTFKDGSKVYGWFGVDSYASSDHNERDLFISHAVAIHPKDNGEPHLEFVKGTKGVYVKADDLRSVEFIEHQSEDENQTSQ